MSSFSLTFLFHYVFETGSHIVLSVCMRECVCMYTYVYTQIMLFLGVGSCLPPCLGQGLLSATAYARLPDSQAARDLPITPLYLAIEVLGLQMPTLVSSFMGILIYLLKHLSSLTVSSF